LKEVRPGIGTLGDWKKHEEQTNLYKHIVKNNSKNSYLINSVNEQKLILSASKNQEYRLLF
jgi:hypothetical protein